jgi:DNA-binding NtrC family response regulator
MTMTKQLFEPPNLLIIDDHVATGLTLKAILERESYRVWYASNADQADDLLESQSFDFAIIDLDVDRNGINVLKSLKARQPHCSAMILTGYPSQEAAEAAFREGAVSFMTKPCDVAELKQTVRQAIARPAQGHG